MPTTVDRFLASWQLAQQIADIQNNMRKNASFIKANKDAGVLVGPPGNQHVMTFADAQQAFRDLGSAFLTRIAVLTTLVTNNLTSMQNGTAAVGIVWTDVTDMKTLLTTWATNLSTSVVTNQTQMDTSVAALLAAVPAAIQPY